MQPTDFSLLNRHPFEMETPKPTVSLETWKLKSKRRAYELWDSTNKSKLNGSFLNWLKENGMDEITDLQDNEDKRRFTYWYFNVRDLGVFGMFIRYVFSFLSPISNFVRLLTLPGKLRTSFDPKAMMWLEVKTKKPRNLWIYGVIMQISVFFPLLVSFFFFDYFSSFSFLVHSAKSSVLTSRSSVGNFVDLSWLSFILSLPPSFFCFFPYFC